MILLYILDILHSFLQYYCSCVFQVITHQRMWHNSHSVQWMDIVKNKDVHEVSTVCSLDLRHYHCYPLVIKNILFENFCFYRWWLTNTSQQMLNYYFFIFLPSFSHWCFQPQSVQAWHRLHHLLIFILHLSYLVLLLLSLVSRHSLTFITFIMGSVSLNFIGQCSIFRCDVPVSVFRLIPYAILLGFSNLSMFGRQAFWPDIFWIEH